MCTIWSSQREAQRYAQLPTACDVPTPGVLGLVGRMLLLLRWLRVDGGMFRLKGQPGQSMQCRS
eukprot:COSAG02_NODE_24271_length_693_cov_1.161616_2_plen_63_part_01